MAHIESVGDLISRSATLYGKRVAYLHNGATLTFGQLARDADTLSHQLRSLGVSTGEPVAVVLDKSLDFIRALAAIVRAGGIYVPVDAGNPDERIRYILRDSTAQYVVTTSASVSRLSPLAGDRVRFISVDRLEHKLPSERVASEEHRPVRGDDIAYIIYTSGSTHMPKGVAIRHDSLLNYIRETVRMYGFNQHTRILSVKPFSYDASFTDLFCPLYAGGRVYLLDESLIFPQIIEDRIRHHGITHISCTIPVFTLLAQKGRFRRDVYATMKTMSVGGDVVAPGIFHSIKSKLPRVRVFNRYGPTETTVACCTYEITGNTDPSRPVPIGKPHRNVCFKVVNERGKAIGVGESGELYIGGVQVMAGYWRAPELTAKVIASCEDGLRYYKTSDLVTLDENGDYVFVRRLDNIVKKHGYRINLTEIEAAIVGAGLTDECVCVYIPGDDTRNASRSKIVAYLRVEGTVERDQSAREKLLTLLPRFMVPDILVHTEQIPKELSGKPARQLLRQMFVDGSQTTGNAH